MPSLPPQTAIALEVSGAAENARRGWAAYAYQIDAFRNDGDATAQTAFREQFGLQFPQDLEALLGTTSCSPAHRWREAAPRCACRDVRR